MNRCTGTGTASTGKEYTVQRYQGSIGFASLFRGIDCVDSGYISVCEALGFVKHGHSVEPFGLEVLQLRTQHLKLLVVVLEIIRILGCILSHGLQLRNAGNDGIRGGEVSAYY